VRALPIARLRVPQGAMNESAVSRILREQDAANRQWHQIAAILIEDLAGGEITIPRSRFLELEGDLQAWPAPDGSGLILRKTPMTKAPTLYRKRGLTPMVPWDENTDMQGVSASDEDKENGSPKAGDMIARNPHSPEADRWLISKAYFEANYELAT